MADHIRFIITWEQNRETVPRRVRNSCQMSQKQLPDEVDYFRLSAAKLQPVDLLGLASDALFFELLFPSLVKPDLQEYEA